MTDIQQAVALEERTGDSRWGRRGSAGLWLARRLLAGLLIVWLVSVLVFLATQALPSDAAKAILGREATPDALESLRHQLGLDRPLLTQYADWISGVVQGDFGDSLAAGIPVSELLSDRIQNSFTLVAIAALITVPLCILSASYSATHRDGVVDKTLLGISLALTAVPEFVVGVLLLTLFATTVTQILPPTALLSPGESPLSHPDILVLPVTTLVLAAYPYLFLLVRASMIEVLESDYVQMAKLKGLSAARVMLIHALPNAIVPGIQATAIVLAYFLGGVIVIEYLFSYPGLGTALIDAVSGRDLPVIQAIIMIFAGSYIVFNIVADVLTVYASPRLRTKGLA